MNSFDALHRIAEGPEAALDGLGEGLVVGHRRLQLRVPVHQAFAAEDEAVAEHVEERLPHGPAHARIEREARALPVAAAAQFAELAEDALLVLVLPLPDAAHQFLAAEVVARLLLLVAEAALHHGLRGDAGVVGAGHPQGVVALHAPPADQHVLQRVVEGVAHVQGAGHVRRRDDDAERLAVGVGLGCGSSRARSRTAASAAGLPWGRTAWEVRSPSSAPSLSQRRPENVRRPTDTLSGAAGFGGPPWLWPRRRCISASSSCIRASAVGGALGLSPRLARRPRACALGLRLASRLHHLGVIGDASCLVRRSSTARSSSSASQSRIVSSQSRPRSSGRDSRVTIRIRRVQHGSRSTRVSASPPAFMPIHDGVIEARRPGGRRRP